MALSLKDRIKARVIAFDAAAQPWADRRLPSA
jgi:hypothetical protein